MELYNDHFQNFKRYNIPRAQLVIADIPYNIGQNAYASSPEWYESGSNKNGESKLAHSTFFDTDKNFNINEFMHFVHAMLKPEPKEINKAGCMIIFCGFAQQFPLIEKAKTFGFNRYINLVFRKNYSAQVLKANMRIVGNCEYGIIFYRDKLPKYNNHGQMIFNCFDVERDTTTPKIHPTQKSIHLLKKIINIFTDPGDVVIDPVAGSGVTLLAAEELGRKSYGFEIKKEFVRAFEQKLKNYNQSNIFSAIEQKKYELKKLEFMNNGG